MPIELNWLGGDIPDRNLEQPIGEENFQDPLFLYWGWRRASSVCLFPNLGTGFMISESLVLTNWHVFRRDYFADNKKAVFGYEKGLDGLANPGTQLSLRPDIFFRSNENLDYAVIHVDGEPGSHDKFGNIPISQSHVTNIGRRINIIQHPGAGLKKIAIRENALRHDDGTKLQYYTDTEHGSSGSPVFNDSWEVVGLHFQHDSAPVERANIYYNEAYRTDAIWSDLLPHLP